MKRPKPRRRCLSEAKVQRLVFDHLRSRQADGVFVFAVPNGGYRRLIEAANLKRQGVTPGVPDIIACRDGQFYAMELKAENGRTSEAQQQAIARLNHAGAFTATCYGLDAALRVLEAWKLLKGKAV